MTYATTPAFLEYFGLAAVEGLPSADELRRIPVQRPDALVTADPNGGGQPQDQLSLEQAETPAGETPPAEAPAPEAPAVDVAASAAPEEAEVKETEPESPGSEETPPAAT
jgi:segregation and condensation protein B